MQDLTEAFVELIRRTSTDLPADMEQALPRGQDARRAWIGGAGRAGYDAGQPGDVAPVVPAAVPGHGHADLLTVCVGRRGFDTQRVDRGDSGGPPPRGRDQGGVSPAEHHGLRVLAGAAVSHEPRGPRPPGACAYAQGARDSVDVRLLMKGGGCENVGCSVQPAPLHPLLNADRDMEGVRLLHPDARRGEGAGTRLCARGPGGVLSGGTAARRYAFSQAAALPAARRPQPGPGAGRAGGDDQGAGQRAGHWPDGLWRRDHRAGRARWTPCTVCRPASLCRSATCAGPTAGAA